MKRLINKLAVVWLAVGTFVYSTVAVSAGLPTTKTYNGDEGDLIAQFKGLVKDAFDSVSTGFGAIAAVVVGVVILVGLVEWRKGQKELSEVATMAAVAAVVLTIVYILLNLATDIIG